MTDSNVTPIDAERRTLATVSQEYSQIMTQLGDLYYRVTKSQRQIRALLAQADTLNTEGFEMKKAAETAQAASQVTPA